MRAAAVLLGVAACYKPVPPEGRPCSDPDLSCPTGLQCFGGFCLSEAPDAGDGLEAQPPDALPDGPPIPDADPSCHCVSSGLECGGGMAVACPLGCSEPPDHSGGHCIAMVPSNGVDAAYVTEVSQAIEIGDLGGTGATTIDTDSGAITGALTRMPGTGVSAGIGYHQASSGGAQLGIFVFSQLTVDAGASIKLVGSRAAVFLVATDATVVGTIDGSGGCTTGDPSCGGPGAGTGGTAAGPATGCGPGGDGVSAAPGNQNDGGGGGGGGGQVGGGGGSGNGDAVLAPGGTGGLACLASTLEPLVGGGGGGTGGGGNNPRQPGGGGGGALQISAMGTLAVTGTINMAGEGGTAGPAAASNGGAGGGAGAGGGILLEAPTLTFGASVILACNGGGGGSSASNATAGAAGANGHPSTAAATGGNQTAPQSSKGGDGGAIGVAAQSGDDKINGGGGGGAVGAIHLRASQAPQQGPGTFSPAFTSRTISTM